MRSVLTLLGTLALSAPLHAAAIVGVVTESGATLNIGPSLSGATTETFEGTNLSQSAVYRDNLAVAFESIAEVGDGNIFFKNGNTTSGIGIGARSRTVVKVTVTNDGNEAIAFDRLDTVIIPAEIGFFVTDRGPTAGCNLADINSCPVKASDFDRGIARNNSFSGGPGDAIARTSFFYSVVSEGIELMSLSSSLELLGLAFRPDTFTNGLSISTGGAENVLANFRQTGGMALDAANRFVVDDNDPSTLGGRFGLAWDETPVTLTGFGDGFLAPGASREFIFTTEVVTRSDSFCDQTQEDPECVGAFGSFGDPIGDKRGTGGGGTQALSALRSFSNELSPFAAFDDPATTETGINYGLFSFKLPVFDERTGALLFNDVTEVPEPAVALLFGLSALGLGIARRRRASRAA